MTISETYFSQSSAQVIIILKLSNWKLPFNYLVIDQIQTGLVYGLILQSLKRFGVE